MFHLFVLCNVSRSRTTCSCHVHLVQCSIPVTCIITFWFHISTDLSASKKLFYIGFAPRFPQPCDGVMWQLCKGTIVIKQGVSPAAQQQMVDRRRGLYILVEIETKIIPT